MLLIICLLVYYLFYFIFNIKMWVIEPFYHKEKFLIKIMKFLFAVWHNLEKKNVLTNLINIYIFWIKY